MEYTKTKTIINTSQLSKKTRIKQLNEAFAVKFAENFILLWQKITTGTLDAMYDRVMKKEKNQPDGSTKNTVNGNRMSVLQYTDVSVDTSNLDDRIILPGHEEMKQNMTDTTQRIIPNLPSQLYACRQADPRDGTVASKQPHDKFMNDINQFNNLT